MAAKHFGDLLQREAVMHNYVNKMRMSIKPRWRQFFRASLCSQEYEQLACHDPRRAAHRAAEPDNIIFARRFCQSLVAKLKRSPRGCGKRGVAHIYADELSVTEGPSLLERGSSCTHDTVAQLAAAGIHSTIPEAERRHYQCRDRLALEEMEKTCGSDHGVPARSRQLSDLCWRQMESSA